MQYYRESPFQLAGGAYTAKQIIETLSPHITDERMRRIGQVAGNRTANIVTLLDNLYDRGNVSAVMRSAEAFGFFRFHIIEQEDAKFKAANRVTQGTDKWLDVVKWRSGAEAVGSLQKEGFKVYATHLDASVPIDDIDFKQPTAVVFGNERDGVSDEVLEACDGRFILPMQGFAQSFNISVAAALTFYHIFKQRKFGDLSVKQREVLVANYILRSVAHPEKILAR